MAQYDNTNTGALFKAKEQPTDKHPGYTGTINVDGKEYYLAAWIKESPKVGKYFSLSVKPKEAKPEAKKDPARNFDDLPDDLPF